MACLSPLRHLDRQVVVVIHQAPPIAAPVLLGDLASWRVDIAPPIRIIDHYQLWRSPVP